MMAWKVERIRRKQDAKTAYVTVESDPVSIRIMAAAWNERERRHGGNTEENLILTDTKFARTLRLEQSEQQKLAHKLVQRLFDKSGTSPDNDQYIVQSSDIAGLSRITIEAWNGKVTARTLYADNGIRWIDGDDIAFTIDAPLTRRARMEGRHLEDAIKHPFTDGLGLVIDRVSTVHQQDVPSLRIMSSAWRPEHLVPFSVKVN
jgi:hypothetical protein